MAKEYGIGGQEERRTQMRPKDQHGREWWGTGEIGKRGVFPCGPMLPSGWSAPWRPDPKYYVVNAENPLREFTWDYDAMLRDTRQAHAEYHARAISESTLRGWPIPEKGGPYSAQILQLIGPAPKPVEPILAAKQGNSWILGFTKTPDPRLVRFVKRPDSATDVENEPFFGDEPHGAVSQSALDAGYAPVTAERDELDDLLDLEEAVDPHATGGQRVKVGGKRK